MGTEFGIFTEEGCIENGFYSRAEAEEAVKIRYPEEVPHRGVLHRAPRGGAGALPLRSPPRCRTGRERGGLTMDTFNEQLRRIGMMLVYGQTLEEIHEVIAPEDEGQFYLVFRAAQRWAALSVDEPSDRLYKATAQ